MPFISLDSPIRKVPVTLSRKEILFLDGIRYCIESFELVSIRLARTLNTIGQRQGNLDSSAVPNPIAQLILEATVDAWTLIDVTHRLRELLQQTPKLKKNEPQLQLFLRRSESIEELRNYFQHFRTEINSLAEHGMPLWGTLSWISEGNSTDLATSHIIIPGTHFPACRVVGCTFDTLEHRFIERVVLHAGQKRIDLADLHDSVEEFVKFYIAWFETTFRDTEQLGADVHICLALKRISKENANPAKTREDEDSSHAMESDGRSASPA